MKTIKQFSWLLLGGFLLFTTGCSNDEIIPTEETASDKIMTFKVWHPSQKEDSRVTSTSFEDNDSIGLYITEGDKPLELAGNRVNNKALIKQGNDWTSWRPIYWNKGTYQVYAYYPYNKHISSTENYPFVLASNQNEPARGNSPSGYEASDFLWAQQKDLVSSDKPVELKFSHRMSRFMIELIKGENFEGDFPSEAEVYVHNTVTEATIDLSVGVVTRERYAAAKTIRAKNLGRHKYAAIIVPQRLDYRQPLVEVIMNGVSYLYESRFIFKPGIQHTVKLIIDKNPNQAKIEFGGEVKDWEN